MTKLTQKERRERKKSKQTPNKNECYSNQDTDDENDNIYQYNTPSICV